MNIIRFAVGIAPLLLIGACELYTACDQYVDYICDCHADDADFDCNELRTIYAAADEDTQAQCQIELNDQQAQDEDDGLSCEI